MTDVRFRDDRHLIHTIQRMVARIGRRIDESSPMVDARLPDGSRVNAIIPPLAIDGAVTVDSTVLGNKALSGAGSGRCRRACPTSRWLNYLSTWPSAPGARSSMLGRHRRRQDDDAQHAVGLTSLKRRAHHHHRGRRRAAHRNSHTCVRLESRPPNLEGKGEVRIRDLVKNALRMRPGSNHRRRGSRR